MFGTKCCWTGDCFEKCEVCGFAYEIEADGETEYLKSVKEDIDFYYRTQLSSEFGGRFNE